MLLVIISKQLLRHEFVQASHTMEAVTTAMDQVPEVIRKVHVGYVLSSALTCELKIQIFNILGNMGSVAR